MNGADVAELFQGDEALHVSLTVESLVMGLLSPLIGAGVEPLAVRRALLRVAESDEAWLALGAVLKHAEAVAVLARDDVRTAAAKGKGEPS